MANLFNWINVLKPGQPFSLTISGIKGDKRDNESFFHVSCV